MTRNTALLLTPASFSYRPMLFEKIFNPLASCKPALARGLEASVNARKFLRRRMIFAGAEPGIDLKREFSELRLSCLGPTLDSL